MENAYTTKHVEFRTVYPNPTNGDNIKIDIGSPIAKEQFIHIYDAFGREWRREVVKLNEGINTIELQMSNYPAGPYRLMLQGVIGKRKAEVIMIVQE